MHEPILKMTKGFFQISIILVASLFIGCSNSDSPLEEENEMSDPNQEQSENPESSEEQSNEEERSIFFSKISYENFIDNRVAARVEFQFQDNKVVRQEGYNPDGTLQNYSTYEYDEDELLKKLTYYNSDGSINYINNFSYQDKKLSLIERIRNNVSIPDTTYNVITYSNNLIENEFINSIGNRAFSTKYFLNSDGFIYRSDNGNIAEVTLEDGVPISKVVQYSSNTVEFDHVYIENASPKGPWKDFWGNFYGSFNNQIVQNNGGLISYEDTVDLSKYIVSVGSQLQREYEFNSDGLPTRIEKTFDGSLSKSIWQIEYQD